MKVLRAMQLPKPMLLEGSPGVGKTSLISILAKATGHNIVRINLSEQTVSIDYVILLPYCIHFLIQGNSSEFTDTHNIQRYENESLIIRKEWVYDLYIIEHCMYYMFSLTFFFMFLVIFLRCLSHDDDFFTMKKSHVPKN